MDRETITEIKVGDNLFQRKTDGGLKRMVKVIDKSLDGGKMNKDFIARKGERIITPFGPGIVIGIRKTGDPKDNDDRLVKIDGIDWPKQFQLSELKPI